MSCGESVASILDFYACLCLPVLYAKKKKDNYLKPLKLILFSYGCSETTDVSYSVHV